MLLLVHDPKAFCRIVELPAWSFHHRYLMNLKSTGCLLNTTTGSSPSTHMLASDVITRTADWGLAVLAPIAP